MKITKVDIIHCIMITADAAGIVGEHDIKNILLES